MTVLSDGDRVHLVDRKGRQYALTLKAGDTFQLSGETLAHDDLIGKPDGTLVTLSRGRRMLALRPTLSERSEEHTSELQSQFHLVCRLLLEKKKDQKAQSAAHTHGSDNIRVSFALWH